MQFVKTVCLLLIVKTLSKHCRNIVETLSMQVAEQHGCHQCLWLFGKDHEITEVGAMNLFMLFRKPNGGLELTTPPLTTGLILPGVTRRSILELTSEWPDLEVTERRVTMGEVVRAMDEDRLVEMFGSGTAAVVSPVGGLHYDGQLRTIPTPKESLARRILASMSDIYYGRIPHPWAVDIEEWNVDAQQVWPASLCQAFADMCVVG